MEAMQEQEILQAFLKLMEGKQPEGTGAGFDAAAVVSAGYGTSA